MGEYSRHSPDVRQTGTGHCHTPHVLGLFDCVHIKARHVGEPAELSPFLTDRTFGKFKDPADPEIERERTELPERIALFRSVFDEHLATAEEIQNYMKQMRATASSID